MAPIGRDEMGDVWPAVQPGRDAGDYGSARLDPTAPAEVRSFQTLTVTYTVGRFGLDDTGAIRIALRWVNDCGPLQTDDPAGMNHVTAQASNGVPLEVVVERYGYRPWSLAVRITVTGGFMRPGETIRVVFGDRAGDRAPDLDLRLPRPARTAPAPPPSAADGPDPLSWETADRRDRGRWVHAALESFGWWEDGLADVVPPTADAIAGDRATRDAWWEATRAALSHPDLRPWISAEALRAEWDVDELELWRERDFVVRVEGRVERGRYDRVALGRRQGRVVRAQILDWKTDRLDGGDPQAVAAPHARQLSHYARALAQRTGLAPDAITTALVFLDGPVAVPLAREARG